MLIGGGVLIVLGVIIGTMMGRHAGKPSYGKHIVAHISPTPERLPTLQPLPRITFLPTAAPRAKASPSPAASPKISPLPSASPSVMPIPTGTAAAAHAHQPTPRHTRFPVTAEMLNGAGMHGTAAPETPLPEPAATRTPKLVPSSTSHVAATPKIPNDIETTMPAPRRLPSVTSPPTAAPVVLTPTRRAERLVRNYIHALIRGDEVSAFHDLGVPPGDKGANLSEESFIDHSAHITSVTGQTDAVGTNVQAEVDAKHGLYFLTFKVAPNSDGQLVITEHDFIKP